MTQHRHAEMIKAKVDNDTEAGFIHLTNNCGELKIVDYMNARNVLVEFIDTGYRAVVQMASIRKGKVKDPYALSIYGVGFIGEGHLSRDENGHTKAYQAWHSMMNRCYNKECNQYDNYGGRGVFVDESWHNFQNFAQWFYENYIGGYEIDKDKLSGKTHGDVYSDKRCCFLPPQENTAISQAKTYSIKSPSGVDVTFTNIRAFCRMHNLDRSALSKVIKGESNHHKGWSRIKPRKVKKWIGITKDSYGELGTTKKLYDSIEELKSVAPHINYSDWQFIEVEVEI